MTVRADPGVLFICCKLLFALQAKRDSLRFRARRHSDGEDHLQRRNMFTAQPRYRENFCNTFLAGNAIWPAFKTDGSTLPPEYFDHTRVKILVGAEAVAQVSIEDEQIPATIPWVLWINLQHMEPAVSSAGYYKGIVVSKYLPGITDTFYGQGLFASNVNGSNSAIRGGDF